MDFLSFLVSLPPKTADDFFVVAMRTSDVCVCNYI